ncbi:MAG: hypothetical protein JWQ40_1036 [Segetibacter sp.]|nr:hypothetical protein [Segetibacter sp.]
MEKRDRSETKLSGGLLFLESGLKTSLPFLREVFFSRTVKHGRLIISCTCIIGRPRKPKWVVLLFRGTRNLLMRVEFLLRRNDKNTFFSLARYNYGKNENQKCTPVNCSPKSYY